VSDLQCPATLLLVRPGAPDDAVARAVAGRRLAAVYSDATASAGSTAEALASAHGVRAALREGLETSPSGELSSISDEHRGETVAVVARTGLGDERAVVVEVVMDADGWAVRSGDGPA
jgi:hypothetical protein